MYSYINCKCSARPIVTLKILPFIKSLPLFEFPYLNTIIKRFQGKNQRKIKYLRTNINETAM